MPDQNPRQTRLHTAFAAELTDRVERLQRIMFTLEQAHGEAHAGASGLEALAREAHSLKAAARAVEAGDVEQVAHGLEEAGEEARSLAGRPADAWFGRVNAALDWLAGPRAAPPPEPAGIAVNIPVGPDPMRDGAAEPATPATNEAGGIGRRAARADSVRVTVSRLDHLLAQSGELAVSHSQTEHYLHEVAALRQQLYQRQRQWRACRGLRASLQRLSLAATAGTARLDRELETLLRIIDEAEHQNQADLQRVDALAARLGQHATQLGLASRRIGETVLAARLVPVASIVGPFERMVRDLARTSGKEVQLRLEGGDTEIDRRILEQLRDPLIHMLRNAVDHGIETPSVRQAAGKPRRGTIRLAATQRGGVIVVSLGDDGTGLDAAALRDAAVRKGLLSQAQAAALDDQAAFELIFQPGFSTRAAATATSGRGVGMDVVRQHVDRLNGEIALSSSPGRGATVTITVPLTLATTRAVLVDQGGQCFAVPSASIERAARVRQRDLVDLEGRRAVVLDGRPIPAVELAALLELPDRVSVGRPEFEWRAFVVLRQDDRRVAVLVDRLVGEQEIVVKPLGWPLRRVRNVGGVTVLGAGQVVAILTPADLLKSGLKLSGGGGPRVPALDRQAPPRQRRVLVVDDSLPTRSLLRSILEAGGYATAVAVDGVEALTVLHGETIDLVVTDAEMPRLDGFALTAEMRRDERLRLIPVVVVTSLASREDRERGVAAGADAYIVKGGFDQEQLLATVGRLL